MTKATRRIPGSPALLAIALIVGLPAIGNAQLFPNRTVKRERPACVQEPAVQRPRPPRLLRILPDLLVEVPGRLGLSVPQPRAAKCRRVVPTPAARQADRRGAGGDPGTDDPANPGDMPADPMIPPIPNPGRSPFDIDSSKPGATDPAGTPPVGPLRNPNESAPSTGPSPSPGTAPRNTPIPAPTGLLEMPRLPSPTTSHEPGSMTLPAPDEAMLASASGSSNVAPIQANLGPLPTPRGVAGPVEGDVETIVAPAPAQAQAPAARKGVLGGLFNRRRR